MIAKLVILRQERIQKSGSKVLLLKDNFLFEKEQTILYNFKLFQISKKPLT